jgi:hypothetical protein
MRISTSVMVSLSILSTSATVTAADERLQGLALEATSSDYSSAIELKTPPVFDISAGRFKIVLEETTLAQIAEQFGGKIHGQGDAGEAASWLCYNHINDGAKRTIWFQSGEMGGEDKAVLSVAEAADGGTAQQGCTTPTQEIVPLEIGVPGTRSTNAELTKAYGVEVKKRTHLTLSSGSTDPNGFDVTRTIYYKLEGGNVSGVAISQVTTN